MPELLVINANTLDSITDLVAGHVRRAVGEDVSVRAVSGRFGARYIATESASVIAAHAALDAYAVHGSGCDAVLLACFGDPGLFALRELCEVPVVGLAEASMRLASRVGRFSVVTGGARWPVMLERLAGSLGFSDHLVSVRSVMLTGVAIAADPEGSLAALAHECREARERDGAAAVILGGAGLAGLAARVAALVGFPVIDSVIAGALDARALALGGAWSYERFAAGNVTPSIGLPDELGKLLRD